jgi:hypothetical protein
MLNFDADAVVSASTDLNALRDVIDDAVHAAASPTTGVLPAGVDEVSQAITALLNSHGTAFQGLAGQASMFHQGFTETLRSAVAAYVGAEQAAGQSLRNEITSVENAAGLFPEDALLNQTPKPITVPTNGSVGLILGGTIEPYAPSALVNVPTNYLPGIKVDSLVWTPEQFFPFTPQLGGLTLNQSITAGVSSVNSAINTELAAGNHVTVFGVSQSSAVLTEEIRSLMAQGSPNTGNLNFVLTGDPNNPDGGLLERLSFLPGGGRIPFLQINFNGATPSNSPYQTAIYTNQYDGFSDFPQHPLNVVSDLNAVMGIGYGQHDYSQLGRVYYQLPTSPGYTGATSYYMSLDTNTLPLLVPLWNHPALVGLLQPDLRVICDLGYNSAGYANVPATATVFDVPNVPKVAGDLLLGARQGVDAFGVEKGWLPQSMFPDAYPYLPEPNPDLTLQ